MEDLVNYLSNPQKTFKEGLAIYSRVKRDSRFDVLFSSGDHKPGTIAFNLMETELRNILRIRGVAAPAPAAGKVFKEIKAEKTPGLDKVATGSLRIDANPMIRVELLPEDLRAKFERNQLLIKLIAEKHAYLQDQSLEQVDAANASEELVKMDEESQQNWLAIDTWFNENRSRLEAEKQVAPMSGDDIGRNIKRLKDNINRTLKDIDAQKPNIQENRKVSVAEWEKQILALKEKGKLLKDAGKTSKE